MFCRFDICAALGTLYKPSALCLHIAAFLDRPRSLGEAVRKLRSLGPLKPNQIEGQCLSELCALPLLLSRVFANICQYASAYKNGRHWTACTKDNGSSLVLHGLQRHWTTDSSTFSLKWTGRRGYSFTELSVLGGCCSSHLFAPPIQAI